MHHSFLTLMMGWCTAWASLRFEKNREYIDHFRRFIETFSLFSNRNRPGLCLFFYFKPLCVPPPPHNFSILTPRSLQIHLQRSSPPPLPHLLPRPLRHQMVPGVFGLASKSERILFFCFFYGWGGSCFPSLSSLTLLHRRSFSLYTVFGLFFLWRGARGGMGGVSCSQV